MGYAYYDTALGPAGYSVEDTCHEDGCTAEIDRGLGYLCGNDPGSPDEHGCGKWFCDKHLYVGPVGVDCYLCNKCLLGWDGIDSDEVEGAAIETPTDG